MLKRDWALFSLNLVSLKFFRHWRGNFSYTGGYEIKHGRVVVFHRVWPIRRDEVVHHRVGLLDEMRLFFIQSGLLDEMRCSLFRCDAPFPMSEGRCCRSWVNELGWWCCTVELQTPWGVSYFSAQFRTWLSVLCSHGRLLLMWCPSLPSEVHRVHYLVSLRAILILILTILTGAAENESDYNLCF